MQTPVTEPLVQPKGDCILVNQYDWNTSIMYAICMAESGGNPNALGHNKNGTTDGGLLQINSIHVNSGLISSEDRFIPEKNLAAAYAIYKGSGYKAWSSYNSGVYLKYL